jgi:DNA-binding NtrC family response regulator
MEGKVFICDDEEGMLRYLRTTLGDWGLEVETYNSPLALLVDLEKPGGEGDVLLLDIRMPQMDGLTVLQRSKTLRPELEVILMTGQGSIDSAVEAMKLGAYDYLTKPFPEERLQATLGHALERGQLLSENRSLKKDLRSRIAPSNIIFRSRLFRDTYELALRVASSDANVLLLGESGTGKELIAGAIHYASGRCGQRFLALNCAALTETLLESQLFGHVRGAFTGAVQNQKGLLEEAHGGTLFLDEIGDLSPALQVKLLRVLQEGEFLPVGATRARQVDVRFVAATNKDLEKEVAAGTFREDLFYRLNVISLQLPPLRARPEDIEPLALHFLAEMAGKMRRPIRTITPEAMAALRQYSWPGNVRELRNAIERGAILARGEAITLEGLPVKLQQPSRAPRLAADDSFNLKDAERLQVLRALRRTRGNKTRAADLLGVTRKTLDRKMQQFGLSLTDLPEPP